MSNANAVQEMVNKAIAESDLAHRFDGEVLEVLAPAVEGQNQSTAVRVRSKDWNEEKVVVLMSALVLYDLPPDDAEVVTKAHIICNRLNQDQLFGRWVYYPDRGEIEIEHELVGESIGRAELLSTIGTLGHQADRLDESLQNELGAGERRFQETL